MRKKLDGARTPIERGRMSRKSIWDTACVVAAILKSVPVVCVEPSPHVQRLQDHVHSILLKSVTDVCVSDVKTLHDLIDDVVYKHKTYFRT